MFVPFAILIAASPATQSRDAREPALSAIRAHVYEPGAGRSMVALTWPGKRSGYGCTRYRKAPHVEHSSGELVEVDLHPPRWVGEPLPGTRRCSNQATFTFATPESGGVQTIIVMAEDGERASVTWSRDRVRCTLQNASGVAVARANEGDLLVVDCRGPWIQPARVYATARFGQERSEPGLGRLDDTRWSFSVGSRWRGSGDVNVDFQLEQAPRACDGFAGCEVARARVDVTAPLKVGPRPWRLHASEGAVAELMPLFGVDDAAVRLSTPQVASSVHTNSALPTATAATTLAIPAHVPPYAAVRFMYQLTGPGTLRVSGGPPLPEVDADSWSTQYVCLRPGDNALELTLVGGDEPTIATVAKVAVDTAGACP